MLSTAILMLLTECAAAQLPVGEAKAVEAPPANRPFASLHEATLATQQKAESAVKDAQAAGVSPLRLAELQVALHKARLDYAKVDVEATQKIEVEARRRFEIERKLSGGDIELKTAALTLEATQIEVAAKQLEVRRVALDLKRAE